MTPEQFNEYQRQASVIGQHKFKTAVNILYEISKRRDIEKADWDIAFELERQVAINMYLAGSQNTNEYIDAHDYFNLKFEQ